MLIKMLNIAVDKKKQFLLVNTNDFSLDLNVVLCLALSVSLVG